MEHLEELLINSDNLRRQKQLFGLLFDQLPTYEQVIDGTPELNLYFKLNRECDLSKLSSCDLDRIRTDDLLRDRETC